MFRARSVEIILLANTMESMHAMAVLVFSSAPSAEIVNMFANRKAMDCVKLIKLTAISVVHVALKSASKSEWTEMLCNTSVGHEIPRCANKWQCSSTKMLLSDSTKPFLWRRQWCQASAWICQFPALPIHFWRHHHICQTFRHPAVLRRQLSHRPPHHKHHNRHNTQQFRRHIRSLPLMQFASQQRNFFSWMSIFSRIWRHLHNYHCPISCCCLRIHGENFSSWELPSIFCPLISRSFSLHTNSLTRRVMSRNQKSPQRRW